MLERLAGNDALKAELGTALRGGRLPHAVLLVEPGCGTGFAARCLAADYLYPAGGPHAEAVLKKEDTECLVLQGEGASGQIPVKKVREAREAIQLSALSTDAAARVLFIYGAQNLNGSSANAMLKIIEEPPEDTFFVFTAQNRYRLLPTVLSRVTCYTLPPAAPADCLRRMKELAPGHTEEELNRALLRCGGSPETGAALLKDPAVQKRYAAAEEMLAGLAMANPYRAIAAAAPMEKDRAGYTALLETLAELLANPALREMYNLPGRAAAGCRAQIAPLLQMCERNAHLPLVTALLTERCRR